jgi:hypothetical protein
MCDDRHGVDIRSVIVRKAARPRPRFRVLSNVMTIRFVAGTAVALDLALGALARSAGAQEAQRVFIKVPPVTRAQPSSATKLSIQVGPQQVLPNNSSIRIRGLPLS